MTVAKSKGGSRFPPIHLAPRQYGSKEGKPAISFTSAELQVGVEHLKHTLVAKFSSGRPPIDDVRKAFIAAWSLNGQVSIGAWDARHILIVLDSDQDACKVLAHPMRKLGHSMFRVFRWTKDFNTRREPSTTTAWIRLNSLPPELYNQGYIATIVSSFARFLAVDNRTMWFSNPSYARACVEIDISKDLPNEVWISTGAESGFWQEIVYENRLQYCSKCHLHGHLLSTCRKVIQRQVEEKKIWAARDEHGFPTAGSLIMASKKVEGVDSGPTIGSDLQKPKTFQYELSNADEPCNVVIEPCNVVIEPCNVVIEPCNALNPSKSCNSNSDDILVLHASPGGIHDGSGEGIETQPRSADGDPSMDANQDDNLVPDSQTLVIRSPSPSTIQSGGTPSHGEAFQASKVLLSVLNKVWNEPSQNSRGNVHRSGRVHAKQTRSHSCGPHE
ncbi:hypothetical protein QQ045_017044 [Rhodiola kirilowii]